MKYKNNKIKYIINPYKLENLISGESISFKFKQNSDSIRKFLSIMKAHEISPPHLYRQAKL